MKVICIEEKAFYTLMDGVIKYVKAKIEPDTHDKWIGKKEAMQLLRIKSPTTLQKLRDAVIGDRELLLLGTLAQTLFPYRTIGTYVFPHSVFFLLVLVRLSKNTLVNGIIFPWGHRVMVFPFIVDKAIGTALVGAMGRDEALR